MRDSKIKNNETDEAGVAATKNKNSTRQLKSTEAVGEKSSTKSDEGKINSLIDAKSENGSNRRITGKAVVSRGKSSERAVILTKGKADETLPNAAKQTTEKRGGAKENENEKKVDVSLIVPIYNEVEVLDNFFSEMEKVLLQVPSYHYEIIYVDDGSTDGTLKKLKDYAKRDKRIKIVSFSRNFGKEAAMMAGLRHCGGSCAVIMDADLQDPPELLLSFLEKWEENYQMVYGIRTDRTTDSFLKKLTAKCFYYCYNLISKNPIVSDAGDYRLLDRKIIDILINMEEKSLFMKGLYGWIGFNSCGVNYSRPKRTAGKTKWNYWKLWNFALDGLTASSTLPLRIWTYVGLLIMLLSLFIYIPLCIFGVLYFSIFVFAILNLFSLQFVALGILGEYIGRVAADVKNRPLYLVQELINLE